MKVLIRARLGVNELEVSVRGAEVSVARLILGIIGEEISEVSKNYAGITTNHNDSEITNEAGDSQKWWEFDTMGNEVPVVPELF